MDILLAFAVKNWRMWSTDLLAACPC